VQFEKYGHMDLIFREYSVNGVNPYSIVFSFYSIKKFTRKWEPLKVNIYKSRKVVKNFYPIITIIGTILLV